MKVRLEVPYEMAPGTVAGIDRTIVRVTTSEGVTGLGEAPSPDDAAALRGDLGQQLVGRDGSEVLAELGRVERPPAAHRSDGKVLIRGSFAELVELRRSTAIPFSAHTPDLGLASELGVPDALVLGLGFCGGIAGTRRFIAECQDAGVAF